MDKWIALTVAAGPIAVAVITTIGLIISARIGRAPLPDIKQGETVPAPAPAADDDDDAWEGRVADLKEQIVELRAERDAARAETKAKSTRIAILLQHCAIDAGWHRRNPDPSPTDPHPQYLEVEG